MTGITMAVPIKRRSVGMEMIPEIFDFFAATSAIRVNARKRKIPPGNHPEVPKKYLVISGREMSMSAYIARNLETMVRQITPPIRESPATIVEKARIVFVA